MGWWSPTIMGGDTPLDMLGFIEEASGIRDLYPIEALKLKSKKIRSLRDWFNSEHFRGFRNSCAKRNKFWTEEDTRVLGQVITVVAMAVGAHLPKYWSKAIISEAIGEIDQLDESGWRDPSERLQILEEFIRTVEKYDETPTFLKEEGLFEKMSEVLDVNSN